MNQYKQVKQTGVALIMVIIMIAITSALLVSLTSSTYVSMRLNRSAERRVEAEYMLKSAVEFARVLIKSDTTPNDDPSQDAWMQFEQGREVPGELIGIGEPGVRITLQISSEKGKIPLLSIIGAAGVDTGWRDIIEALFLNLGFDQDQPDRNTGNDQPTSLEPSAKLVANLIDYLDEDKESYSPNDGFTQQGYEDALPAGDELPNSRIIESASHELRSIPGFTASRVKRILPHISLRTRDKININAASVEVLKAVIHGLDKQADAANYAQRLVECRDPSQLGPYDQSVASKITECIGDQTVADRIATKLVSQGDTFYVLSKVEFGSGVGAVAYIARAHLRATAGKGRLPAVESFLLY